jgi:hypothetical protein
MPKFYRAFVEGNSPNLAGPLLIARSTPKPCGASSQPTHRWREMDSNHRYPAKFFWPPADPRANSQPSCTLAGLLPTPPRQMHSGRHRRLERRGLPSPSILGNGHKNCPLCCRKKFQHSSRNVGCQCERIGPAAGLLRQCGPLCQAVRAP